METNNIDINSFYKVIVDLASEGMLRTSQEELASRITEYDEEIKSLLEEKDSLRKKRDIKIKIQSEEKLKKTKIKRMFALWGSFASFLGACAFGGYAGIHLTLLHTFLGACALSVSCFLLAFFCVYYNVFEVKEVAKLSLAEIDEKIRELEETLQLQRDGKNVAMRNLAVIRRALGEIDQTIASCEFDRQVSTLQNSMSAEDNLEQEATSQADLGNVILDQADTKENGMSLTRKYKEKKKNQ